MLLPRHHIGLVLLLAVFTLNAPAMSRYSEPQKVRKPAVAGSFYPSSAHELKSMLDGWIRPTGGKAPQAIIVPHAGYVFSGEVAASAFSRIPKDHPYKRIFLVGPSHRVGFTGASVDTLYSLAETPLGKVAIDTSTGKELINRSEGAFTFRADAHDREHCLEVQLPFLQTVFEEVPPVVPIVIGTQRLPVLQKLADTSLRKITCSSSVPTFRITRLMTMPGNRTYTWRRQSLPAGWTSFWKRFPASGRWISPGRTPPPAVPAPSRCCWI